LDVDECVQARDEFVSAALAEADKIVQCPTLEQSQSFSKNIKCHGLVQRQTSRIFHFRNEPFASCNCVCKEGLGPIWRRENPTLDLGAHK
jgi:hypothetical protein